MRNLFLSVFAFSFLLFGCSKDTPAPVTPAPTVDFSYTGAGQAPSTVSFTSITTNATTYLWDFGDNGSSTAQNPQHTYTSGGVFTVKLTATGGGGSNSVTKTVNIIAVTPPTANFSFSGDNKEAPDTVTFVNTSANATSYSWDFGDGNNSTVANPQHTYSSAGTFTVTLTATGTGGNATKSSTVTILNPTQLKFKVIDNLGNTQSGATVVLYKNSTDYTNKTNPVLTSTTDANGYFLGTHLSSIAYYYRITNGCYDNYGSTSTNHLSTPLTMNILNSFNPIVISSKGSIKLTSTSSNPYEVWIDGNVQLTSMTGGTSYTVNEVPVGNHSVRVLQLSGYVISATDETFTATVTCGGTSTITFP